MEAGDAATEGSISSLITNSIEFSGKWDMLSSEDLAWVDSCLISDPNVIDSNWDAWKDALLEALKPQGGPSDSASKNNGFPGGIGLEALHSGEVEEAEEVSRKLEDYVSMEVDAQENNNWHQFNSAKLGRDFPQGDHSDALEFTEISDSGLSLGFSSDELGPSTQTLSDIINSDSFAATSASSDFSLDANIEDPPSEKGVETEEVDKKMTDDDISSKAKIPKMPKMPNDFYEPVDDNITFPGNPFRPDFKDEIQDQEKFVFDSGLDFGFSAYAMEPLNTDIFKEWDLEFPEEEDEFSKLLNKFQNGNLNASKPNAVVDLPVESVDSLVAGLNELSLGNDK